VLEPVPPVLDPGVSLSDEAAFALKWTTPIRAADSNIAAATAARRRPPLFSQTHTEENQTRIAVAPK
jgi:hypothetical protein